ncbi:XF1762 family protein [Nocardia sp. XZ_19_385]|uniref:XF1762 family protein n=1 Tax=Nocardia sp. XZ_19_385 TaxID=2769488 RepID=UPI001E28337B|nr:XF1762 family protein [Nocardia sp. XZ_19_385]
MGHKFSLGVAFDGVVVGVCIVGRPAARFLYDGTTLEVSRLATDGTRNAASLLLGTAWRAAKALGYTRLVTYTRHSETGSSLRGAGFHGVAQRHPRRGWDCPTRPRLDRGTGGLARTLWEAS